MTASLDTSDHDKYCSDNDNYCLGNDKYCSDNDNYCSDNDIPPNKLLMIASLETSDHDGYCSGNECQYEMKIIEHTTDAPNNWQNMTNDELIEYLPPVRVNTSGSYYCDIDNKSVQKKLGGHDYRYTIIKIEEVEY